MRILFIWPSKSWFSFKSMSLALFSAILKQKGHEVEVFDTTFFDFGYEDNSDIRTKIKVFKPVDLSPYNLKKKKIDLDSELYKKLTDFRPHLVGISALSDEAPIGHKASKVIKRWNRDVPVIWGNKAATMAPERVLADENVDYVCIGEGIEFIREFVDCLDNGGDFKKLKNIAYRDESGAVRKNPLQPFYQDLDSLPYFDLSVFDQRQFVKPYNGNVYTGCDHMIFWGCPYNCTFCINHAYRKLYGRNAGKYLRHYSVDRIVDELNYLRNKWNITLFHFHDEDFCIKPGPYLKELSEKYSQRVGVPFVTMANARNVTREKVSLLKKMNCVSISIGIETGNTQLRRNVLKRTETEIEIVQAVQRLHDAGIRTSSFNMLGIPFETRKTVMDTVELNRRSNVQYPNTVFFYPLENTELRKIAIENGFFEEKKAAVFDDLRPSLKLRDISEEELISLRERFVLYVKMPKAFYKYIERSEQVDDIGKRLAKALFDIYEAYVLNNNGQWKDNGEGGKYLKQLELIANSVS